MNINRINTIRQYNPHLSGINPQSPLSVGNGRFCFTADVTGMQTLYEEYLNETPLCTMAEWAWHTTPAVSDNDNSAATSAITAFSHSTDSSYSKTEYTMDDVKMTEYDFRGRTVSYPRIKFEGNEAAYDWVRQNPHKFNLARITFTINSNYISSDNISDINQRLDLTTGILKSEFSISVDSVKSVINVETVCDNRSDTLAFKINSNLLKKGLGVDILFPYAACDITGSDWEHNEKHYDEFNYYTQSDNTNTSGNTTYNTNINNNIYNITRNVDETHYSVLVQTNGKLRKTADHRYHIDICNNTLYLCIGFNNNNHYALVNPKEAFDIITDNVHNFWNNYWNSGKFFYHENNELMRRVILSQYLLIINDSGYIPPAETGLTCNSWYGKAHLEMHYWHMAWAPLWGHPQLLERSFDWYISILPEARKNAAQNGYKGARWTKMVSYTGKNCPSKIAPLLIWQQPHIINMLQMVLNCYENDCKTTTNAHSNNNDSHITDYMNKYWILVKETAEFMEDYLVYDISTDTFNIEAPVIPVQERHLPEDTRNPVFELAYFRYGLKIAAEWADKLKYITLAQKWNNIADRIAPLPVANGLYISHANCPDTFTDKAIDHPLMLQVYGMLDDYGAIDIVDMDIYRETLNKVIEVWDYSTLWGWDFAVIAMAANKLGLKDTAIRQLLIESPKNEYVASGNNRQNSRKDLPLYLPGNGSLLIAVAKMFFHDK